MICPSQCVVNDDELRQRVRRLLRRRQLPRQTQARTWGGPGLGKLCSVCGKKIDGRDQEYELQFVLRGDVVTHRFHARCHAIWELERSRP